MSPVNLDHLINCNIVDYCLLSYFNEKRLSVGDVSIIIIYIQKKFNGALKDAARRYNLSSFSLREKERFKKKKKERKRERKLGH